MEKPQNVKGIFLDLGGTLLYPPSGSFMFSELAKKFFPIDKLHSASPKTAAAARKRAAQHPGFSRPILTVDNEYAVFLSYYTALSEELGLGLSPEDLRTVAGDKVYNKAGNNRLFEDTAETLKALSDRYRLGIISDTWPSIVPVLEQLGILKYFYCFTYSYELAALKPDVRMYRDALDKMGLPAENTLFVDDNPKNLAGAAALGIAPVLISAEPWSPELDRAFGIDSLQTAGEAVISESRADRGFPRINKISGLLELL